MGGPGPPTVGLLDEAEFAHQAAYLLLLLDQKGGELGAGLIEIGPVVAGTDRLPLRLVIHLLEQGGEFYRLVGADGGEAK